jgi:hypothetical protein
MKLYFTLEASFEVLQKLEIVLDEAIETFFEDKTYSEDLEHLYISVFCMHPKFADSFRPRKEKYTDLNKKIIHKGVEIEKKAKTFEYEIRLDFNQYNNMADIRQLLANDIIDSLDKISLYKKIKNLNLDEFKADFRSLFRNLKWL